MSNAIRVIGSYAIWTAILGLTAFGMATMGPNRPPSYQEISPAHDFVCLGEEGQRRFFADPLSSLPSHTTGFQCRRPAGDGAGDGSEPECEQRPEIGPPRQASAEIP